MTVTLKQRCPGCEIIKSFTYKHTHTHTHRISGHEEQSMQNMDLVLFHQNVRFPAKQLQLMINLERSVICT